MIAGFLVMLWLVPIDAVSVPVSLPVDSQIDRFALGAVLLIWLIVAAAAGKYGPRHRRSPINVAVIVFLSVATASVVLNVSSIARTEELSLAIRQLVLIFSYVGLFLVVITVIRKQEVPRFIGLMIVLACLTAIGVIIEYRTGTNYFFELTPKLIPGVLIDQEPVSTVTGRPSITGPTQHGLAVASILAMAMPFALVGLLKTRGLPLKRLLYGLALGIMLAGALATQRKTSLVVPAAALIPLIIYRPREIAKLIPIVAIVMALFIPFVAPGAVGHVWGQLTGAGQYATESRVSTLGRTSDYAAVTPDILSRPLLGRGYGTYDPNNYKTKSIPTRHRFLDNQYLGILIGVGIIGLIAYLSLAVVGIAALHRSVVSRPPDRSWPALAIVAAIAAFMVANVLFDLLAFAQVPYVFFFLLALGGVIAAPADQESTVAVAPAARKRVPARAPIERPATS